MLRTKHELRSTRNLFLLAVFAVTANLHARPTKMTVAWQPPALMGGSAVWFEVRAAAGTQRVSAAWLGQEIRFFESGGNRRALKTAASFPKPSLAPRESSWYGLAGISLETPPGTYELKVTEVLRNGKARELVRRIRIGRAVYPKITVKVARQFTEPSVEQVRQINVDKEIKQQVFAKENPKREWKGRFLAPVSATISDVFGTERVFNGEVQSRHLGLDYAVPSGTPVRAINRGQVILARPLYFEGNCIIVDHGQGLLSLYLHLSEFKVREGEEVETGQLIGLSGGSGRATGPHLHLAIRWKGSYLNPQSLLRLRIPVMPAEAN